MKRFLLAAFAGLALVSLASAQPAGRGQAAPVAPKSTRTQDIVYGRKDGLALTLDAFEPARKNGGAVFFIISSGFTSSVTAINVAQINALTDRGYVVFAVMHGSQPRYIIPEMEQDIQRAIRFVRANVSRWGIDPNKFGITGQSAGGHLALKMGVTGGPGQANARDPVDRESSAVQAVTAFYPVSDFANFSKPGELMWEHTAPHTPPAAFGPKIDTREGRQAQAEAISTIKFVTAKMAPTLIYHGAGDTTVPVYQSQMLEKKCQEVGATFKLIVKPAPAGHGGQFGDHIKELDGCADWFDQYLLGLKAK